MLTKKVCFNYIFISPADTCNNNNNNNNNFLKVGRYTECAFVRFMSHAISVNNFDSLADVVLHSTRCGVNIRFFRKARAKSVWCAIGAYFAAQPNVRTTTYTV